MTAKTEWTFPASFGQERIWLSNHLDPASPVYNVPDRTRFRLALTESQWSTVLGQVVARQESLRTSLRLVAGELLQVVHADVPIEPELHDLRDLPPAEREARAEELALRAARTPIPLDAAPLWRAQLCRLGDADWQLTFVVHHAVFDAGSVPVLARELAEAMAAVIEGREPRLPEPAVQYADYSTWQQGQVAQIRTEQLAYWRAQLAGIPLVQSLPTDRPRPAELGFDGGQVDFDLPARLVGRVGEVGRALSASPFMVLLTGYAALLSRLSRSDDLVIGVPLAGRELPEVTALVGMFVNQLAIRVDCSGDPSFAELTGRVRTAVLDAIDHGQVPFQLVSEEVGLKRDPGVQAVYQLGFNFTPDSGLEDLPFATAKDDIAIDLGTGNGRLLYRTDLFDRATAESIVERYFRLLEAALDCPGTAVADLPLLDDAERTRVLTTWNDTAVAYPDTETIHGLIEQQVLRTPDAVAVDFGGQRLSYAELNTRANRIAHRLRAQGAGPGRVVGVCASNSAQLVAGLVGVLKSGAAYVPVDPALPAQRQALILGDAAVSVVLTAGESIADAECLALDSPEVWVDEFATNPAPSAGPDDVAYVLYTSGSTGRPKGVQVEHRSVAAYLTWARQAYPSLAGPALLHTSASFDLTVTTLLGPLVSGGSIVDGSAGRPAFVKATPTHLAILPDELFPSGDLVLGGEALTGEAVRHWRERHPGTAVTNEYGPTEATVGCVAARIAPGKALASGPVSIGRPIANIGAYVLDDRLEPVPPGVPGQLHIAGPQVARGYLGRPELTAERFRHCPFGAPGARMYATGDLVRWREDGTLHYLGRIDEQLKVRGHRIEPGEIEVALCALPGVRESAVAVRGDNLVGYLVGRLEEVGGVEGVREALARTLPEYLVPTVYVPLDALPMSAGGKLDRGALPMPEPVGQQSYVAPSTAAEEMVAEVLGELLAIEKIGVHEDFFDSGGNSLLAIRAMARIRTQAGVKVAVRDLFSFRTVAELAAEIELRLEAELDGLSDDEVQRLLAESDNP